MDRTTYKIVPHQNGWAIEHNGDLAGHYATKIAAFEAANYEAENAIRAGDEVHVHVPGGTEQG
jgi:hypothetical protein